jgi:hypothetical protein
MGPGKKGACSNLLGKRPLQKSGTVPESRGGRNVPHIMNFHDGFYQVQNRPAIQQTPESDKEEYLRIREK